MAQTNSRLDPSTQARLADHLSGVDTEDGHQRGVRPEAYLTDAQFCQMIGVTSRTSNEWRRNNTGPAYVRVGPRRILYRRSDVDAWLASRTFRHRAAEVVAHRQAA